MIATTIATPSAAPTCRETEFRPVAVAKLSPGADATAAAVRFGNSVPAPTPRITIPGNHTVRNSGVAPARSINQMTPPAQSNPPATSTGLGPVRPMIRLLGPAAAAATNGPGVRASPAWRIEYRQTPVRNSTLTSV